MLSWKTKRNGPNLKLHAMFRRHQERKGKNRNAQSMNKETVNVLNSLFKCPVYNDALLHI